MFVYCEDRPMPAYWKPRQALTFLDCIPKCLPSSLDRSKISWGYGFMQNVPYPVASVASLCPAIDILVSGDPVSTLVLLKYPTYL